MKAAFALISLLPFLAAAGTANMEASPEELPKFNVRLINIDKYKPSPGDTVDLDPHGATTGVYCPRGNPFRCGGFCCQSSICCPKQCCSQDTDFCGADGHCYVWTINE